MDEFENFQTRILYRCINFVLFIKKNAIVEMHLKELKHFEVGQNDIGIETNKTLQSMNYV